MKRIRLALILLIAILFQSIIIAGNGEPTDSNRLDRVIESAWREYTSLHDDIELRRNSILNSGISLRALADLPKDLPTGRSQELLIQYLLEKDSKEKKLAALEMELLGLRYQKGIDFIKLLYEKILSLEHHFVTIQTLQNIQSVSNPHNFDEFESTNKQIRSQLGKRQELSLPEILNNNPYVSMVSMLVSSFIGSGDKAEKEANLDKIACILDFTVRMHGDLKLIYYETEFLKSNALALKRDCEETFARYVNFLNYPLSLPSCRDDDDWLNLEQKINTYLEEAIDSSTASANTLALSLHQNHVDFEFSIHLLYSFMHRYSAFVEQGTHYYHKFIRILKTYQNEDLCRESLPEILFTLQRDMDNAMEKFKSAYYMKELQGSKLKELLFGRVY